MKNNQINEKLLYLMGFIVDDIEVLINKVLADSESEPQWSAVTAENMILCYIDVMRKAGVSLPFCDVAGCFADCGFTECEYEKFEQKRKKEAQYYIGKQFRKT